MTITNNQIKELERITADLGDLLLTMHPGTIKEWDVFDGAVTSHKHLRKLDTDSLRQLELPLPPKSSKTPSYRTDCPRCEGKGSFAYPEAPLGPTYDCSCWEIGDTAWPQVKKEWEAELEPSEV